ncbi:MAG: MBL fold metallo-hydrolase [Candidatus Fermentithermobacillus carboniphilus]|uniref:MBL fold metallo-hydrolase n=1 Tax=Candidatus Fermentithermobacillus carboniphilus TaxID=3085328 RepID=A0AAT9LE06_9FIRM|nr:MAG: MBL fold metallo-hydrolase [Candidatus Fermentithermobacillus carboniphilus]
MVRYLGHASFLLVSPGNVRIVTDPFGPDVPYPEISISCDVATVSHEHHDHNYVSALKGNVEVLRGLDPTTKKAIRFEKKVGDVTFRTVPSYHDAEGGRKRGENAIFVMEFDGLKVVHLGDLGHSLSDEHIAEIGPVDVVMVPVGGYYTIDAGTAKEVVRSLKPRVVVPMHYKTRYTSSWPIAAVDEFIRGEPNVKRVGGVEVNLKKGILPEKTEVWVFDV